MNPILFDFGFIQVYWYSIILLVAFLIGGTLAIKEAKKWKTLNSYINMSIENHLADIRPSKKFTYNIEDFKNEISE